MPKYTDSPFDFSDKLQGLADAKSQKLQSLTPTAVPAQELEYKPAVMTSLHDLDSPGFDGVEGGLGRYSSGRPSGYDGTGKPSKDRIVAFDSNEVHPGEQWKLDELLSDPSRVKQLDKQRVRMANERGVPLGDITYEDIFQKGGTDAYRFMINAAADAQGNPEYSKLIRDWEIPEETSSLWRTQNPGMDTLNIPMERADSGKGFGAFGRPLTEVRTLAGEQIGEAAGYTQPDTAGAPVTGNGIVVTREQLAENIKRRRAENLTAMDEVGQTVAAVPAGIAKGALDLVDALQEGITYLPQLAARAYTGNDNLDIDLFNDEYKKAATDYVDSAVGYDRAHDEKTLDKVTKEFEATGIDITSWESIKSGISDPEKLARLSSGALEFLTNPSLTVGMFTEIIGSGLGFGATTKAGIKILSKVAPDAEKVVSSALKSNVTKIKEEVGAAAASGNTARMLELQNSYTLAKMVPDLLKGSVYTNADMMVRMNNDITEYKKNNNDEAPDAGKLFQMAALNRIVSSAEVMSLKSLAGIKDIPPAAAKEATRRGIIGATGEVLGKVLKIGGGGLQEGTQEFFDTVVEQINQKVDAADFENQSIGEILSAASAEILTGTFAGAAGGVHMKAGSTALSAVGLGAQKLGSLRSNLPGDTTTTTTAPGAVIDDVAPTTQNDIAEATKTYGELLKRFATGTATGKVTADNIGTYLDDVEELNRTKHVIKDISPDNLKAGEAAYEEAIDRLESFVKENPDIVLSKRIVRKNVAQSVKDKDVQDRIASVPEESHKAIQELGAAFGDGDIREVGPALGFVSKSISNGTYESVVQDPEALAPYLKNLESRLTGSVSEDLETTFSNLQSYFQPKKEDSTVESSTGSNVLGSTPSSDESFTLEEGEYDDYSRAIDAERIVHTLLGSGRSYDEDFSTKLVNFAQRNGVDKKQYDKIIKSFASVDEEAQHGARGYLTRLSRIKGLMESSNPNTRALNKESRALADMEGAISSSAQNIQRGIKGAKAQAAEYNRTTFIKTKGTQFKTEYKKDDGTNYLINIRTDGAGKWVADTKDLEKTLKIKEGYINDIKNGLKSIRVKEGQSLPDSIPSFGEYKVPVVAGKGKEQRTRDDNYVKSVTKTLKDVGLAPSINKVILGEKTSDKWKPRGDYYKANSLLVNDSEFTGEDVVLVNALGITKKTDKFDLSELFASNATKDENLTAPQRSFAAAVEAGATVVLDKEMLNKGDISIKRAKEAVAQQLVKEGYEPLEGYNSFVFVKKTHENKKLVAAHKSVLKKESDTKAKEVKDKERLLTLARSLRTDVNHRDGEVLTSKAKAAIEKEYKELSDTVTTNYFSGKEDNVTKYLDRELGDRVKAEVAKILKDPDPKPLDYKDKALTKAVQKAINEEEQKDAKGSSVLQNWKSAVEVEGLTGKEREAKIKELLTNLGAAPKALANAIMTGDRSFAVGQKKMYELVYKNVKTGNQRVMPPIRNLPSEADLTKWATEGKTMFNVKHILLSARPIAQDPNDVAAVVKTTVLNSVPIESLPFTIRDTVKSYSDKLFNVLQKVMPAELSEDGTDVRVNGKFLDGSFNLHNSVARGVIFNKEGKPNPEVMAAMYLAIGDMLKTDMMKMTRGYKTDADLARVFNIEEFEVTDAMRDFSKEHGVFVKTAANSIGKTILRQLGIAEKRADDISYGEYQHLVADIGNSALLLAEKQGILEITSKPSNEVAKMYRDGEQRDVDTDTYFIHVKDKNVTKGKYTNKEPIQEVKDLVKQFDEMSEVFPEAVLGRKEGHFSKPTEERMKKALTEVRNDQLALDVPSKAKQVITSLMNTAYEFDMERIGDFLDLVAAPGSKIKEVLGFIEIPSDKYDKMLNRDKEIQEVKNRSIEKSIEELKLLKTKIEKSGKVNPSMYFDYYYTGNNRYNLDSNTVDPMTDKLHRFFVVPKLHRMKYDVSKHSNGSLKFTTTSSTGTTDQSYVLRMALAQALGHGVDKLDPVNIISIADGALSLSKEALAQAKQSIITTGKYTYTDKKGKTQKIEADHLSHTLQAINFLEKVQSGGSFESNLSLEFDSLTSGFANKGQQMPILDNMDHHLARTGVFTPAYQRILADNIHFKGAGVEFNPSEGHSVSDVLHAGSKAGFFDSYQNLAKTVIEFLRKGDIQRQNLSKSASAKKGMSGMKTYEAIKSLLPGGELIDSKQEIEGIEGAIRNLFKEPFMIFNYSAGIKRIVTNLGINVAQDLVREIATTDFNEANHTKDEDKQKAIKVRASAEKLIASVGITNPATSNRIKTAEELQVALRDFGLKKLKIDSFVVGILGKTELKPTNLEALLENIVKLTYGEVVKDVFEKEFKQFIEVQDAMNDTFKVSFRIFDHKRMKALHDIRQKKPGKPLTAADHAQVLEDLWDDFPWIVGPLTGSETKGTVRKDVIAVSTTTTRSARPVEEARVPPQTLLGSDYAKGDNKAKSRKVTPLMRYLEEAQSAGSVLPFHGIDGAEIGSTIVDMAMDAFIAVHDAIIPPLDQSDKVGFIYNKNMADINSRIYALSEALNGLTNRMKKTISSPTFSGEFKDSSVKGLKTVDQKDKPTFADAAKDIVANMESQINLINNKRKEYYGPDGLMKGAWYGNLVSTPGSMFLDGADMFEPDLSYKEKFEVLYDTDPGKMVGPVAEPVTTSTPQSAMQVEGAGLDVGLSAVVNAC